MAPTYRGIITFIIETFASKLVAVHILLVVAGTFLFLASPTVILVAIRLQAAGNFKLLWSLNGGIDGGRAGGQLPGGPNL